MASPKTNVIRINLLTKEFREGAASIGDKAVQWLAVLMVIVMLGLGAWQFFDFFNLSGELAAAKTDLERTQKKVAEIKGIISLEDSVKKGQTLVQNVKNAQLPVNTIISGIQAKTPSGVNINSVAIKPGTIDLQVEAASFIHVEKFVDSLRQDKNFTAVEVQSLAQDTGKPVISQISFKYGKGGQGK